MSQDSYVGLHGRNPYEQGHTWADADGSVRHYVPEDWEDLDRGICPECGRTVRWDEGADAWVLDPSLTVLVLTEEESQLAIGLLRAYHAGNTDELALMMERQYDRNRPYIEVS